MKSHELNSKSADTFRELVRNYIKMFGRDGRINYWMREDRAMFAHLSSHHRMGYSTLQIMFIRRQIRQLTVCQLENATDRPIVAFTSLSCVHGLR